MELFKKLKWHVFYGPQCIYQYTVQITGIYVRCCSCRLYGALFSHISLQMIARVNLSGCVILIYKLSAFSLAD